MARFNRTLRNTCFRAGRVIRITKWGEDITPHSDQSIIDELIVIALRMAQGA